MATKNRSGSKGARRDAEAGNKPRRKSAEKKTPRARRNRGVAWPDDLPLPEQLDVDKTRKILKNAADKLAALPRTLKKTGKRAPAQVPAPAPGLAADWDWLFLNLSQRDELADHLRKKIKGEHVEMLMECIDSLCVAAKVGPASPREIAEFSSADKIIAGHASELELLLKSPANGFKIRKGFIEQLDRIRRVADASAAGWDQQLMIEKTAGIMGRPSYRWRDHYIYLVSRFYPTYAFSKTAGGHFERTIELTLGYLGRSVADVHGVILRSIARGDRLHAEHLSVRPVTTVLRC